MKKIMLDILHKPQIVIVSAAVLALIIGALLYNVVGRAPVVSLPGTTDMTLSDSTTGSTDLTFLRGGRLATLTVKAGDTVTKGQVLATLDAADVAGALTQARGALELAKAQYASLNVQYANAKQQQDVLVQNAYRALLSSSPAAIARNKDTGTLQTVDDKQIPQISGTYTCDRSGSYELDPYPSAAPSGYSFEVKGLESGVGSVAYYTPQAIGSCGLYVTFPSGYVYSPNTAWIITLPNTRAATYTANKNAYDLAVATRDQVLKQLEANLGKNGSPDANIAQASIDAAEGAYEAAQAAYNGTIITAPISGTVSFIDDQLKVGQTISANKTVITITR